MTIEGNEDSGERFYVGEGRTTRTTHKIPDGTGTVEVLASHAEIGTLPTTETVTLCFGLTNFEFIGDHVVHADSGRRVLLLKVADGTVSIERVPDYGATLERIKAERGIDITAALRIECAGADVDGVTEGLVEPLCRLLSLSGATSEDVDESLGPGRFGMAEETGRLLNGAIADGVDRGLGIGQAVGQFLVDKQPQFLRNSVVGRYSPLPVINPRDLTSTKGFIESAYNGYSRLEADYSLNGVVHAYCSTRQPGVFLELRSLDAATLLDFVCARHADINGRAAIVEAGAFEAITPELTRRLKGALTELLPQAEGGQIDEMAGKVVALNRRAFRRRLRELAGEYAVPMTASEIDEIVQSRNSLVHLAKFATDDHWREYSLLINALDKILLRMLGYEGPYVDVLNNLAVVPLQAA